MKTSFVPLLLVSAALAAMPVRRALADTTTSGQQPTPNVAAETAHPGFKEMMSELNLTAAQKAQIKQIRASTTDKKERRMQVWQVLTPDQQAELKELRQERKASKQTAAAPSNGHGT